MIYRVIIFLVLNFAALGLGGLFTSKGVSSEWYANLSKAPWTPPGWVFGAAWTTIMICFAFYMAYLWNSMVSKKALLYLFVFQWILNVVWNPAFFYYHSVVVALILISMLTFLIGFFLFNYFAELKYWSLLIMPYFAWLLVATSLNAYIFIKN